MKIRECEICGKHKKILIIKGRRWCKQCAEEYYELFKPYVPPETHKEGLANPQRTIDSWLT